MSRIQWTLEQRKQLKAAAIELYLSKDFKGSLFSALLKVQASILPVEHQRKLTGSHNVAWLHPQFPVTAVYTDLTPALLRQLTLNGIQQSLFNNTSPVAEVTQVPVQVEPKNVAEVKQAHVKVEPKTVVNPDPIKITVEIAGVKQNQDAVAIDRTDEILSAISELPRVAADRTDEVLAELRNMPEVKEPDNKAVLKAIDELPAKIAKSIVEALMDSELSLHFLDLIEALKPTKKPVEKGVEKAVAKPVHVEPEPYVEVAKISKVKKSERPMVLVINLFPNQFNEIISVYGDIFDIRSWDGRNDSMPSLERLARNAQRVYASTSHLRHSQDEKIAALAKDKYVRYVGSTSKLKTLIEADRASNIL